MRSERRSKQISKEDSIMSKKNNEEFKVGMTGVQPEPSEDVETETATVDVIEPTTPADQPAQEDAKPEEKKEHFTKLKKFWNEGFTVKPKEVGKKIVKTAVFVGAGALAATAIIGKMMANHGDDETLYLDDSGEEPDCDSGEELDCEYVGGDE
jgi:hypothetical protein